MKLIVGLGNPGKKFQKTRHNAGHLFIDYAVKQKRVKSLPARFVKTTVSMNDSGEEVKKLTNDYRLMANDLLIVHDDMDVALGDFKLQFGRSAAGHKGVRGVIDALETNDFWRLRIGIGLPSEGMSGEEYVLGKFSRGEFKILQETLEEACPRVLEWVYALPKIQSSLTLGLAFVI